MCSIVWFFVLILVYDILHQDRTHIFERLISLFLRCHYGRHGPNGRHGSDEELFLTKNSFSQEVLQPNFSILSPAWRNRRKWLACSTKFVCGRIKENSAWRKHQGSTESCTEEHLYRSWWRTWKEEGNLGPNLSRGRRDFISHDEQCTIE